MVSLAAFLVLGDLAHGQWTLKTGTRVSFLFVQVDQKTAWRPDGSPVSFESVPVPDTTLIWSMPGELLFVVTHSLAREYSPVSVRFKLPGHPISDAGFVLLDKNPKMWSSGQSIPQDQPSRQDVAVGIADGPWKIEGTIHYALSGKELRSTKEEGKPFVVSRISTEKSIIKVTVKTPDDLNLLAVRWVPKDSHGVELRGAGSSSQSGAVTYWFQGTEKDLATLELQTRPFEWKTILGAHFNPPFPGPTQFATPKKAAKPKSRE